MSTWAEFESADPELAALVEASFRAHRHHTMATLRRDGSPRLSGTEITLDDGQLRIGMMPATRRAADLDRDPRLALHSQGVDPDPDEPSAWPGEAKVAGRARRVPHAPAAHDGPATPEAEWFEVELAEVVLTRVGNPADHLIIDLWTPVGGRRRYRRT